MDQTLDAEELAAQVAAAEASLRAAEARLTEAASGKRSVQIEATRAAALMLAWKTSRAMRQTLDRWEVPRLLPVAVLPFPIAFLWFIVIAELTGSIWLAAVFAAVALAAAMGLLAFICMFPNDAVVVKEATRAALVREASAENLARKRWEAEHARVAFGSATERLLKARETLAEVERQAKLAEEACLRTFEGRCHALFQQPWRDMRGGEFERFLAEVLETVGYEVERTGKSGDQGVDLVVAKNGRRVAVQAKGYTERVGNTAIQEAYTGMAHYRCDACAVITNSEFTVSAVSLAESTRCILIHSGNFREFVFGQVDLTRLGEDQPGTV